MIHHGGYHDLFVFDDSLTSKRFTTRTEQLSKSEDEGEVRRLFYMYDRSKAILLLWSYLLYVSESNYCSV